MKTDFFLRVLAVRYKVFFFYYGGLNDWKKV